jgi:hypothetical protein
MYVAIENSWNSDFIGESLLKGLRSHVAALLLDSQLYGRYCSIIQSSGMGKSRLLDEFSKEHFLIPINLRSARNRGLCYHFYFPSFLHLSYRLPPFRLPRV